ncbi:MAG: hypothetical protein Q8934_10215 [Bacillota bacterium]|nr:hypothetical protein [Bacillota bacterium]
MLDDIVSALFDFVGDIADDVIMALFFERKPSNKRIKRIDSSIEELKNEGWFKVLYEDSNSKKYFLHNESIRVFIGKKGVRRIKKKEMYQQRLQDLLKEAYLLEPSYGKSLFKK